MYVRRSCAILTVVLNKYNNVSEFTYFEEIYYLTLFVSMYILCVHTYTDALYNVTTHQIILIYVNTLFLCVHVYLHTASANVYVIY